MDALNTLKPSETRGLAPNKKVREEADYRVSKGHHTLSFSLRSPTFNPTCEGSRSHTAVVCPCVGTCKGVGFR